MQWEHCTFGILSHNSNNCTLPNSRVIYFELGNVEELQALLCCKSAWSASRWGWFSIFLTTSWTRSCSAFATACYILGTLKWWEITTSLTKGNPWERAGFTNNRSHGKGIGSILSQGNIYTLSQYEVLKKVIHLLRQSLQVHREEDGAVYFWRTKENLQNPFPIFSLVWRSLESMLGSRRRSKKNVPVLYWWFRNNCLFQSSSRTFWTKSYWSFITGHCCDAERILPTYLPYWMCVQSSFYHQFWIETWRSEFKLDSDSILSAWSYGQKSQRSWWDWLECTTSRTIRAPCMEETSRRGLGR